MNKLKTAVIGVGSISPYHIEGYQKNPQVELAAFCDTNGLFNREIDRFADCLPHGTPCRAPAEDGVEIMRILDGIYESAWPAVCCVSRIKPPKIAFQAIFYPTNRQSMPDNRDFCATGNAKIHKRDRLLGREVVL
jgi:hypothetical protein